MHLGGVRQALDGASQFRAGIVVASLEVGNPSLGIAVGGLAWRGLDGRVGPLYRFSQFGRILRVQFRKEVSGVVGRCGVLRLLPDLPVEGERLGIQLGFPTANIAPEQEVIPADGVYAVRVGLKNPTYPAVANIGQRPTFPGGKRTVETHLLGFSDELYGERIELSFVRRLREERKFESAEALKEQIAKDIEAAKQILGVR